MEPSHTSGDPPATTSSISRDQAENLLFRAPNNRSYLVARLLDKMPDLREQVRDAALRTWRAVQDGESAPARLWRRLGKEFDRLAGQYQGWAGWDEPLFEGAWAGCFPESLLPTSLRQVAQTCVVWCRWPLVRPGDLIFPYATAFPLYSDSDCLCMADWVEGKGGVSAMSFDRALRQWMKTHGWSVGLSTTLGDVVAGAVVNRLGFMVWLAIWLDGLDEQGAIDDGYGFKDPAESKKRQMELQGELQDVREAIWDTPDREERELASVLAKISLHGGMWRPGRIPDWSILGLDPANPLDGGPAPGHMDTRVRRDTALGWVVEAELDIAPAALVSRTTDAIRWLKKLFDGPGAGKVEGRQSQPMAADDGANVATVQYGFWRHGEAWLVTFEGELALVSSTAGVRRIYRLLQAPGKAVDAITIRDEEMRLAVGGVSTSIEAGADAGLATVRPADAGALLDGVTPEQLDSARALLVSQRDQAQDPAMKAQKSEQIETLDQLRRSAKNKRGRGRRLASDRDRARIAITSSVKAALDLISKQHPRCGEHLRACIKTGSCLRYTPSDQVHWVLQNP